MKTAICTILLFLISSASGAPATQPTPVAHVEQRGNGPVVLIMIPGLSCDWHVYDTFMSRNASRYTMLAVTLPGFGGSSPPSSSDWLDNAEQAIVQLVHERKLDKPIVVGHSLGGHLVTRLAIHHPEEFRGAISIDDLPLFPPPMPGQPDTAESR